MNKKTILTMSLLLGMSSTNAWAQGNLISNNAFDTDISSWTHAFGTVVASFDGTDGSISNGSIEVGDDGSSRPPPNNTSISTVTTCVSPVVPDVLTEIGVSYKVVSGTISGSCAVAVAQSTALNCGATFGIWDTGTALGTSPDGTWKTTTTGTPTVGLTTVSLSVRLICSNTSADGTAFTVRFDDPFVRQPTTPVELQSFSVE